VERGWPGEIGVPTGLGKTTTIDIAVWALAHQAERPARERTAPTRIWYVVDRRLLVDGAANHADALATLLNQAHRERADTAIGRVAARLARVGGDLGPPLLTSRARGGAPLGLRPLTPAQPAIICATVAMYG